jgi:hypothetical protein
MIKRNTLILLGIFVVLLIFAIFYQKMPKNAAGTVTPTPGEVAFFSNLAEKSITSLRIEDTTGKAVVLGRDSAGMWAVTEPKGGPTDVTQAETAVTQLLSLRSISSLDPAADLGIFGLGKPSYTVTITAGSEKIVLLIGDVTPTQNGYYVRLNQNPPDIVNKDSIDALLGLWSNPPFQATPTPEMSPSPAEGSVTPPAETQTQVPRTATLEATQNATPPPTQTAAATSTP